MLGGGIPLSRHRKGAGRHQHALVDVGAVHRSDELLNRGFLEERAVAHAQQGGFLSLANDHAHQPKRPSELHRMQGLIPLPLKRLPHQLIDERNRRRP